MPRAFASIAFTNSVKAAQERYGSRAANAAFETNPDARNELTAREAEFIAARDSFYQATVSESGWPYVQHRGGAPGFLKVLDPRTIGYADFYGNAQYISVGNLAADDRVSLILMDYPNRRRLKIWGRAQVVDEDEAAELIARLEVPRYRAIVERAVLIHVEAFDWNCPQHITPRYTKEEFERVSVAPSANRVSGSLRLGDGPLPLVIRGIRQQTPTIRSYELSHRDGEPLPSVSPGAHLRVPVLLASGLTHRHYSIVRATSQTWEIAVLRRDANSGSSYIHEYFQLGSILRVDQPKSFFPLHDGQQPAVLLAAGIGITPLLAMADALKGSGRAYHVHYAARSAELMAYRNELTREHSGALTTYLSDRSERMQIARVMSSAPRDAIFYACGPDRFTAEMLAIAEALNIQRDRVRLERFDVAARVNDEPINVELRTSGITLQVPADESILSVAWQHGINVPSDCQVGTCGACATRVLSGEPDHRDQVLTPAERSQHRLMCICVSRAHSTSLVLDL